MQNDISETRALLRRGKFAEAVSVKKLTKENFLGKTSLEFLSFFSAELNRLPVEKRLAFLRTNTKFLMMSVGASSKDEAPFILDYMKRIYGSIRKPISGRITRISNEKLKVFFESAFQGVKTPTDYALDIEPYLDLLTPSAKQELLTQHKAKLVAIVTKSLKIADEKSIRVINGIRNSLEEIPRRMNALCRDFMSDLVSSMSELASIKTREARQELSKNVTIFMTAEEDWQPSAEIQDGATKTRLVVIFNNNNLNRVIQGNELWVLMGRDTKDIFAIASRPEEIIAFLSAQMVNDDLPMPNDLMENIRLLQQSMRPALSS